MSRKIKPLLKENYLAAIHNSVGSKLFQNFYTQIDSQKQDIMKGGELSCAFFASSILVLFGLCSKVHGTVDGTILDLVESGWHEISKPKIGAVLLWEAKDFEEESHKHIGFFVGGDKAISNSSRKKVPARHSWTFGGKRKVIGIWWNEKLK